MTALFLKIANIFLLSIFFIPRYISAAVRKPQRRQNYSPSSLLIIPASTTILFDPGAEEIPTSTTFPYEEPDGSTFSSVVVPLFTVMAAPTIEAPDGPTFRSVVPIFNPTPIDTTRSIIMQSVNPISSSESAIFTAPTTYPTKSGDDHSISTTGSIIMQSVTPTMVSTTSFTIQSLTPAATSTASAAVTSAARSVGNKHTWSTSLFLTWIAAVLSIGN